MEFKVLRKGTAAAATLCRPTPHNPHVVFTNPSQDRSSVIVTTASSNLAPPIPALRGEEPPRSSPLASLLPLTQAPIRQYQTPSLLCESSTMRAAQT